MNDGEESHTLFMLRGGAAVPANEAVQAAQAAAQGPAHTASVLVVDDSRTLRRLLVRALNDLGITNITEAANGREGLGLVSSKEFDLVLLDMEMPELDGLQLLYAIKTDPAHARAAGHRHLRRGAVRQRGQVHRDGRGGLPAQALQPRAAAARA